MNPNQTVARPAYGLQYLHSIVLQPPQTVTRSRVLYPPVVARVFLPDDMIGDTITAVVCAVDAAGERHDVLEGITDPRHMQGRVVNEAGSYDASGGSAGGAGGAETGYHTMYFVFPELSFKRTGKYKIRLGLLNYNQYLGDIETEFFDVIKKKTGHAPTGEEAAIMEYLRSVAFWDTMPPSS